MTRPSLNFRPRISKALGVALLLAAACGVLASPLSPLPAGSLPFLAAFAPESAAPASAPARRAPQGTAENRLRHSAAPPAALVAPQISATKTDAFPDPDNDGRVLPGDTITYTVNVTNNGATDAEGVVFSDTVDPNTTLVNGSLTTTPVANNDSYSAVGNVRIQPNAASGLLGNDSDPDGNVLTASAAPTTSQGGNLSVNADGSFSYNPPPGFTGTDSFTYTVTDTQGNTNTASVSISVGGMIWFVDSSAAAGGDGRLTSPFNALTGAGSQPGDDFFLYSGTYGGGFTLQDGQRLIGQAAPASLASIAGVTVPGYSDPLPATGGASPVISGGSNGVTLASNNALWGFTVGDTSNADIVGSGFGTLVVRSVALDGTGQALNLSDGTLDAQFGTVIVNVRTGTGLFLDAVAGTASFGATAIPNNAPSPAGGYGIRVQNSSADITFASANISDANQTVAQTDADANNIPDDPDPNVVGDEGDGDAIFLINNTGSFTLNGGTLSNCANDCIDARNSSNLALNNVTIQTPGTEASGSPVTGGHGVQAVNLSGANSINASVFTGFNAAGRDGVRYLGSAPAASTLTVDGSTFQNSTSGGSGVFASGRDNADMTLVVQNDSLFTGITGPAVAHRAGDSLDSTATVNLSVQDSRFETSGTGNQNTVHASTLEGGKAVVLVHGNTFDNVGRTVADTAGVVDINGDATDAGNSLAVTVTNNTIRNIGTNTAGSCGALACLGRRGIDIFIDDNTNVSGTIKVDGNTLTNIQRAGIFLDTGTVFNGSSYSASITNNTVGADSARVGLGNALSAGGENGIRVENRNNNAKGLNLLVSGNTVRNGNGGSGSAINTTGLIIRDQNSATVNATVTNNNIETNASVAPELRADTLSATSVMCLDIDSNTLAAGSGFVAINEGLGTLNVEQASAAAVATANGIPAANVTQTSSPNYGTPCAAPPVARLDANAPAREFFAARLDEVKQQSSRQAAASSLPARAGLLASNRVAQLLGTNQPESAANVGSGFGYARNGVALNTASLVPATNARAAVAAFSNNLSFTIGTLPAGKSMTITFKVTVNNPIPATQVSNQGTVSGTNFPTVVTDDPDTAAPADPTVTQVGQPATISCPADITVGTDPGQFSASVPFSVTSGGTPAPTVECKVGSTVITSPHTFPVGTTAVQCTADNGVGSPASCSFNVTVNDTEDPVISCPANVTVTLPANSTTAAVTFPAPTATDNGPAPTVTLSHASGSLFPLGTTTVTATATDAAGNTSTCTFTVTVLYNFTGFFSPVANLPTANSAKAGQAIPVKFSLGGNQGLNIFAANSPASGQIPCGSSGDANVIEETITAGGSSLSYDSATGVYTYVWKTDKAWKDTCRQLVVTLADGSVHRANFQFK